MVTLLMQAESWTLFARFPKTLAKNVSVSNVLCRLLYGDSNRQQCIMGLAWLCVCLFCTGFQLEIKSIEKSKIGVQIFERVRNDWLPMRVNF